jgi:alkylhydroperoxidase family enzyme
MDRVTPAGPEHYAQIAEYVERWTSTKGYPPNSWQSMARQPAVFRAYRNLHTAVMMQGGEVDQILKFMVAAVASNACGDSYCEAHNAENAVHIAHAPVEKVRALPQFETSPLFTPAERAALSLARAAGSHPPCVTDVHFTELKRHFSDDAMVEIVAVISLLGWLNRWCQTLAPQIEAGALAFAQEHLAPSGWKPPQQAK